MAEDIALSQNELDKILSSVLKDNDELMRKPDTPGVSLSQSDLDKLLGGGASSTTVVKPQGAAAGADDADAARAAKIAERKARAAEMLARANASSPKRISVLYGSTLKKGDEIKSLHLGDIIELDRAETAAADILVDGKLYGRGILKTANGKSTVMLTELLPQ